jgi:hypothetical protein
VTDSLRNFNPLQKHWHPQGLPNSFLHFLAAFLQNILGKKFTVYVLTENGCVVFQYNGKTGRCKTFRCLPFCLGNPTKNFKPYNKIFGSGSIQRLRTPNSVKNLQAFDFLQILF